MPKCIPRKNSLYPLNPVSHGDFREWLSLFFKKNSCAYCWCYYEETDVDHYIPQSLDPDLKKEGFNLVLSCRKCNQTYKNDYHPQHKSRRTLKGDKSGAHVFDIRRSDPQKFFTIRTTGEVFSHHSDIRMRKWANWNINFFRLNDRSILVSKRKDLIKTIIELDKFLSNKEEIFQGTTKTQVEFLEKWHDRAIEVLKKNEMFIQVFDFIKL